MTLALPLPRSIRAQLGVLVFVAALPVAGILALGYRQKVAHQTEVAEVSARALASAAAAALAQTIDDERVLLAALAARPAQRVEHPAICDPLLADLRALNPRRANIVSGALSGEVVCSGVPLTPGTKVSVGDMDHLRRLLRTGEFSIGDPIVGPVTGRWVVPLAIPRRDLDDRLVGWIGAPLDIERIGDLLAGHRVHPSDVVTVISRDGTVIFRSSAAAKWVGTDIRTRPFVRDVLDGKLTSWQAPGLEGTMLIWGVADVPAAGWKVLAGVDRSAMLAAANAEVAREGLLYLLVLIMTTVLVYRLVRSIDRPVRDLAETAQRIGAGDRRTRAGISAPSEIARIATEFNRMLDALDRVGGERTRLAQVVDRTSDLIGISAVDGKIVYLNRAARAWFGVGAADGLDGTHVANAYPPGTWETTVTAARHCALEHGMWSGENTLRAHDGREIEVSQVMIGLRNERGEVEGIAAISRDITERRVAERQLRERNFFLSESQRIGHIGTWSWELAQDSMDWSDETYRIFGFSPQSFAPTTALLHGLTHPDDRAIRRAWTRACMAGEHPGDLKFRVVLPDGSIRILSGRGELQPATDSTCARVVGTVQDITKRDEVEAALRDSEAKLRKLIDGLGPDMFVGLLTPDGILLEANRASLAVAGIESDDVLGKPVEQTYWWSWSEPAQRQLRAAIERAAAGKPSRYDVQIRVADGRKIWLDFSLQPLRDDAGHITYLVPSALVIDQRKRAEAVMRESEERFRELTDNVRDVFWLIDAKNSTMVYVSPAYEAIWGQTRASLYASPRGWPDAIHPEDRGRAMRGALSKQVAGTYDEEYRIVRPDGTLRWIHDRASAVRDASGAVYRIAGVAEDITDRKRNEETLRISAGRLQAMTNRLLEVQETERRTLAREMHDEIGGSLTAVKLNLQALLRQHQGDAALADGLALVDSAIQAVRSLALDLRPAVLDDLGLIPALRWYCGRQAQRAGIEIALVLDAVDLKATPLLESAFFRVMQEAVTNALRHANARSIRVTLRRDDGALLLQIADDGNGFDVAAVLVRSRAGGSSGLLAMEERVVLLGGRFAVDSTPGNGTRVRAEFNLEAEETGG